MKPLPRTQLQKNSLLLARQALLESKSFVNFTPEQYTLAVLSERMGETKARRFLAKLGITPPSADSFYHTQTEMLPSIENYLNETLRTIRENLPIEPLKHA